MARVNNGEGDVGKAGVAECLVEGGTSVVSSLNAWSLSGSGSEDGTKICTGG